MTHPTNPLTLADLPVGTKVIYNGFEPMPPTPTGKPYYIVVAHPIDPAYVFIGPAMEGWEVKAPIKDLDLWDNTTTPCQPADPITPAHYNDDAITTFDVVKAWQLDFFLGNTLKYIQRHTRKGNPLEDLRKAKHYLQEKINQLEAQQ